MLATCRHTTGAELPPPEDGSYYTARSVFQLTAGEPYRLMGIGVFEAVPIALVRDDAGCATWLPLAAFTVSPQPLPDNWQFAAADATSAGGWAMRWGYPELVRDLHHIEALIEREPFALAIFEAELGRASEQP
jgi:hypothetical protein